MTDKTLSKSPLRQKKDTPRPTASEQKEVSADVTTPGDQSSPVTRPSTRERTVHPTLAALALGLLVAISFFPATRAGFVWDDSVLTGAQPVQSQSGLSQIWLAPRSIENEAHYWPILYTTFWLEHSLWGFNPAGYHIVSLLLHMAVTLLLWRLLLRLDVPGAWIVAAVFAVHPTHVESATWVIGRKDLLASLFYLACALTYVRFAEDGRLWRYGLALLWFVLSLLSKAIAVTLPVSLLIWHWWKQGRVTGTDAARVAPFVLVGSGIIVADWFYYESFHDMTFDYSLTERVLLAAQSLWFYAGNLVWPTKLAVMYARWDARVTNTLAWVAVAAAIAVVVLLWVARHRIGRGALAGVLFFSVTLLPVLGFVDFGYMRYSHVADRYQYLAGIGVITLLVGTAAWGANQLPVVWRTGVQAVAGGLLVVLGTLTWHQTGIYRDSITFYRHITSVNPAAAHAQVNLGLEYQQHGRYEESMASCHIAYRQALEHPADKSLNCWAHLCMGRALEGLGQFGEAEPYYRRAVEIRPNWTPAQAYLGRMLVNKVNRSSEGLSIFQTLTTLKPENPDYHAGMGAALANLGRLDEALRSFERVLELAPHREDVRANRHRILQDMKRKGGSRPDRPRAFDGPATPPHS